MDLVARVPAFFQSVKETRLSGLRPVTEFFDHHRLSRPADLNTATSRISYNTRYFSGNYAVVIGALAVYALLTNLLLIFALLFLVGGFAAINKFAPEPLQVGDHVVTQKGLYTALFVIELKKGGIFLGRDAVDETEAGADEDDFHTLKRRRKVVEEEERNHERVKKLVTATEQIQQKVPTLVKPTVSVKKAKVVKF
ncbi:hypothetical protein FRB99_003834 [Tulasnella sp. 403]|nr:hypothetical protein FRB99_003834 [Tulasnella sp. 403]